MLCRGWISWMSCWVWGVPLSSDSLWTLIFWPRVKQQLGKCHLHSGHTWSQGLHFPVFHHQSPGLPTRGWWGLVLRSSRRLKWAQFHLQNDFNFAFSQGARCVTYRQLSKDTLVSSGLMWNGFYFPDSSSFILNVLDSRIGRLWSIMCRWSRKWVCSVRLPPCLPPARLRPALDLLRPDW